MDGYESLIISALTGLSVFFLFYGVNALAQRKSGSLQRLESYVNVAPDAEEPRGLGAKVDRVLARSSWGARIARNLAQADIKLTVTEFLLLHPLMGTMGLALGALALHSVPGGILLGLLMMVLPQVYVSSAQAKRLQAFNEQLPAALNSLSNSLRGGYGLLQAMKLVATEMGPPMSTEFQRVVSEVSYGLPYTVAFQNMLRRNTSSDLSLTVTAIEINLEVGGNLSEILDNISAIIRDRVRIQAQIRAYTAQTRFSALVLTLLPFGLAVLIYMVNAPYISLLWTTQGGIVLLAIAGLLLTVGTLMLRKVSQIDV